ncbi:MAG TPA: YihY/virulence factor BrkB family protein [Burkholderiales bacterium]|jgi:YihY family inner membrane protein|nr:YihY/virulence factor BrkB family protein [Burkholderiales bacterium]
MPLFKRTPMMFRHPLAFALRVVKAFRANQGLLLAGAIAYYTLLSLVPLLILMVIALSRFIDQAALLSTIGHALEWIAPGQSGQVVGELTSFVTNSASIGWILLATMLVFSSLAFTVLENAMSVIFLHRVRARKRRFWVSVLIPFSYILVLGIALLLGTVMSASLNAIGKESIVVFGTPWSLGGLSAFLLYVVGVVLEILLITSIYMVMPVGRLPLRHALIGGAVAALLWEVIRHGLVWYFGTISQVSVVYGSLTSAIVVLLSFEIAAALLLFGAQVIAEYERAGR